MTSITDFKSEMTALKTIGDISRKAVDMSAAVPHKKLATAAVLAGAIAMASVMQDANAMSTLHPHSVITETVLQVSGRFGCEGLESAEMTLAALDGMGDCASILGNRAVATGIGPEFGDMISMLPEPPSGSPLMETVHFASDVGDKVGEVAMSAWNSLTGEGALKTSIEVLSAALAVIEAIKLVRETVERSIEKMRSMTRRREEDVVADEAPEADPEDGPEDAANDAAFFVDAANDNDYADNDSTPSM